MLQKSSSHGILFPDESWVEWARLRSLILDAAEDMPWERREPRLLFRGGPTGESLKDTLSCYCWFFGFHEDSVPIHDPRLHD